MNYGHGGNIEEIARIYGINENEILDFSANINPVGLNNKVKEAMISALEKIERYPDITYFKLKNAISTYEKIDVENILLGNGAAEVIFNIVRGLKPKKALILAPTFSEYEEALKSIGAKVDYYYLNGDLKVEEDILTQITDELDILFICNPNNPTGKITNRLLLEKVILKADKFNITVVVDESFMDFIEEKEKYSFVNFINKYSNLIVVKSLTKFFAFPGIRIGYGLTVNDEYKELINNIAISWSINTVAEEGAIEALKQEEYMKKTREFVKEEKEYLFSFLKNIEGIRPYRGTANFMFFKVISDINLKEEMLREGILIRDCSNYVGLGSGYYRIAVRTHEENIKFINAMKKVFK